MRRFAPLLRIAVAILLGLASIARAQADEPRRVALLIGNSDYAFVGRLANPVNDVAAMAAQLAAFGFDVETVLDADEREMARAIRAFADRADGADTALFFYAGHGMEIGGRNYLIPVDAELAREEDAFTEAIELERATAAAAAAVRLSVVIVDACRDSRFPVSSRSGVRGFRPAAARSRQIVAFSTAPGDVAQDGDGDLSPYTQALLETLESGVDALDVRILFESFGARVAELAGAPQRPRAWSEGFGAETVTLLGEGEGQGEDEGGQSAGRQSPAGGMSPEERTRFDEAVASETPADLAAFITDYPSSPLRPAAEALFALRSEAETAAAETEAPGVTPTFRDCPDCPEMVALPAGAVTLGSPDDEPGREATEGPQTDVTVAAFALGVREVTVGEYRRFADATGRGRPSCFVGRGETALGARSAASWADPLFAQSDAHPVVCIAYEDAVAYVAWLNEIAPEPVYRLPSEAEWAYAARGGAGGAGGDAGAWVWGYDPNAGCDVANGYDASAAEEIAYAWTPASCSDGWTFTAPTGSFAPNAFGLYDLIGNAWEWTDDCWNGSHRGAGPTADARRTGGCDRRVVRGGSWDDRPNFLRTAHRVAVGLNVRSYVIGFRIARDL